MTVTRVLLILGVTLPCLALSRPAAALDEGERQVSLGLGFTHLRQGGQGESGLGAGLEFQWAFRDAWAARAGLDVATLSSDPRTVATRVGAGVTWAFDVLRVVPFVQAGVNVLDWRGEGSSHQALGGEAALGAHYFVDRRWVVALVGRGAAWPVRIAGNDLGGARAKLAAVELRVGRIFF